MNLKKTETKMANPNFKWNCNNLGSFMLGPP